MLQFPRKELLKMRIPLFDAHCDTASLLIYKGGLPLRNNNLNYDLERASAFSPSAQLFAIWYMEELTDTQPMYENYKKLISNFKNEISKNSDMIALCVSGSELEAAAKAGKVGAMLSVEGAEMLDCSIDKLEAAYSDGVRAVNLTWNFKNKLSGSCVTGGGLTQEGGVFAKRAQELGMLLDMSHISEEAFWDVMDIIEKPVMASHSNSKKIYDHPRNLTDEQFLALKKCGGVAGLNLYAHFIGSGRVTVDSAVEHIEHFLGLGGEKNVALGGDLDGCEALPEGISGVQDIGLIYESMLKRNFNEDVVRDIFYNNLLGVVKQVCNI